MPVTIRQIAKALGMSPSTVSQALNNKGLLRRETRMKVRETARQMGYFLRDDPFGINPVISGRPIRVLFAGSSEVPRRDEIGPFASKVLEGALQVLAPYHTELLWSSDRDADTVPADLIGTIVIGGSVSDQLAASLESTNLPSVIVGSHVASSRRLGAVETDAQLGIRMAIDHLVGLGHRHIGLLNGSPLTRTSDQKLTGFVRACYDYRLRTESTWSIDHPWDVKHAVSVIRPLFAHAFRHITALVCAYESLAIAVLQICQEVGMSVPHDLSVIAYHDEGRAESTRPRLTTVSLPILQMGRLAATHLVVAGENKDLTGSRIVLPPCLAVRESTGPCLGESETQGGSESPCSTE